jgi:hypothetical protein
MFGQPIASAIHEGDEEEEVDWCGPETVSKPGEVGQNDDRKKERRCQYDQQPRDVGHSHRSLLSVEVAEGRLAGVEPVKIPASYNEKHLEQRRVLSGHIS